MAKTPPPKTADPIASDKRFQNVKCYRTHPQKDKYYPALIPIELVTGHKRHTFDNPVPIWAPTSCDGCSLAPVGGTTGFVFLPFYALSELNPTVPPSRLTDTAPLERVKLILQVKAHSKNSRFIPVEIEKQSGKLATASRKGLIYTFRKIVAKEGIFALWRGTTVHMLYSLPNQSLTFALKEKLVSVLSVEVGIPWEKHQPIDDMIIGLVAGGLAGTIVTTSISGILSKKYREAGLRGIYRGLPFSVLGVIVYRSCYFGVFDLGMSVAGRDRESTISQRIVPACVASSAASVLSYPIDTVRRILMIKPPRETGDTIRYVAGKIYRKSGIRGFYGGVLANQLRSTAGAVMLVVYDTIIQASTK
ncbi:unnamed protein product [Allacma fusca]|uniref:ADP/ATP translocase n=1 Tax=Allacma fusca TaxID=39272 RepID=A0A8J2LEK8_9HEXA|nr:unnamed protein product [Allacma fusca]